MSPDRPRVDSFMLADAAQAFGGKLYVHGGGWNYLDIADRDFARPVTIAGRILLPTDSAITEIALDISLEHTEAGKILVRFPIVRLSLRPVENTNPRSDVESATPFVIDIPGVVFVQAGEYAFVMSHEDEEVARTRFQVNFVESLELVPVTEDKG